jgi:hypothetical protein
MQIDSYQLKATLKRYQERSEVRQRNLYKIQCGDLLSVDDPVRVRKFLARRGMSDTEIERLMAGKSLDAAASESVGAKEPDALERVIGTSDLMGVAFLERGLSVSRTVARVWVDFSAGQPSGYGTGFMVSPRLLMTNNHVLPDAKIAAASKVEFNYQLGLDGNPTPTVLFGLLPGAFFLTDVELDYAVVAVDPTLRSGGKTALPDFGFNPMLEEEGKAVTAQWVNIIQHPGGGYKQLALRENQLVDISEKYLTYRTDTAPGSSGSCVMNDRWEVVGLHHSGVPARNSRGDILATDGSVWTSAMGDDKVKWVANEGIRISRIIASLKAKATTGALRQYIDEMLSAVPAPATRREVSAEPMPPQPSGMAPVIRDGTATWTIPVAISVSLPQGAQASLASSPQPVPQYDSGSGGAASDGDSGPDELSRALAEAKARYGSRTDVLAVRVGYLFENGWITKQPAIVIKVRKRAAPSALREKGITALPSSVRGIPVEVVNPSLDDLFTIHGGTAATESLSRAALAVDEILYKPPQGAKLQTVKAKMKLTASVSPDYGWPLLEKFLAATQKRLVVGMYDFGATHICEALEKLGKKAGFKMTLAIQAGSDEGSGTKAKDLPDAKMIARLEKSLKTKFDSAWVKTGIKNGWVATSYHIKVAVRDGNAFWLSSGNWQSSNQPDHEPLNDNPPQRSWLTKYNREWHVVIENAALAKQFETYILNDFTQNKKLAEQEIAMPDILVPGALLAPDLVERAAPFKYFKAFNANRAFEVQPLLTPDNYEAALIKMIRSAEHELIIQNQTFNAATDKQAELGELLDAVIARQNAGVDVRIVFRLLDATKARENLEGLQDRGFDMDRVKVQKNCHTKGVIVDRKRVMIGSQNISQLGITLNRDASVLFEDPELAKYFAEVFEHDWNNLARKDIGSEAHAPELAAGPGAPEGMQRISWKEYMEMA